MKNFIIALILLMPGCCVTVSQDAVDASATLEKYTHKLGDAHLKVLADGVAAVHSELEGLRAQNADPAIQAKVAKLEKRLEEDLEHQTMVIQETKKLATKNHAWFVKATDKGDQK